MNEGTTYYVHYPKLVVPPEGVDVLGGRFEPFKFEDFKRLDPDWAHRPFFESTQPTIWRRRFSDGEPSSQGDFLEAEQWRRVQDLSLLIYYALLVQVPVLLPDPRMSISYSRSGEAVSRRIGPYERTLILNGQRTKRIEAAELVAVAATAEKWANGQLLPRLKVFGPLRCLSLLGSETLSPVLGVTPLVVSLEGYLLGRKVEGGIAAALSREIRSLLGAAAPETLDHDVRRIYAWRSDVLHGRKISDSNLEELFWRLWSLTTAIVRYALQRFLEQESGGDELTAIRSQPTKTHG